MTAVDDILRQLPMDQLAQQLGVDQNTAERAVAAAVPQLIGTMQENAGDPNGERALAGALDNHARSGVDLTGGVNLADVNTQDGAAILGHIFGRNQQRAEQHVSQQAGVSDSLIQKLLPILAPIVLAYIGQQISQNGGFGSILGQILSGGAQQPMPQQHQQPMPQQQMPQQQMPQGNGGLQMPMDPNDNAGGGRQQPQGGGVGGFGGLGDILGQILGGGR